MGALIAEITSYSGLTCANGRGERPALMPLGRQLGLVIASSKAIAANLLGTDLANSIRNVRQL